MPTTNNRLDTTIDLAACMSAILLDVQNTYPQDQLQCMRDSKRIHQQSKLRGQPFFTVELPRLGKALDASLDLGRLDLSGVAHSRGRSPGSKIPRLFQGLWARIFSDDGCLRENADATAVHLLRTLLYVFKKLEVEAPRSTLFEKTTEFFHAEEHLPPVPEIWSLEAPFDRDRLGHLSDLASSLMWCSPRSDPGRWRERHLLDKVQQAADLVAAELGQFLPEQIAGRHGPGAVSELPASKYKYDFGVWSPNLEGLFPFDTFATANLSFVEDVHRACDISFVEEASRLIPVPKDQRGPRLIAAEPISHQWIQQGLAREVRARVAKTKIGPCIDFFDQRVSMVAALEASASRKHATVDLKSASDNLSCYVVQRVFRSNPSLLSLMRACRTRFMLNECDLKQQHLLRLRKFATMGSALTFPIQSIVFAILCLGVGAYKHPRRGWRSIARDIRVFGDDIIVPVDWVPDLDWVLTQLGLEVNRSKTFTGSNFRESCGMDAFRGTDVTPAYVRLPIRYARTPDEVASRLDTSNNLFLKGLWAASTWLARTDPQVMKMPVVHLSSGVSGLMTFTKETTNGNRIFDKPHGSSLDAMEPDTPRRREQPRSGSGSRFGRVRWNRDIQRHEVRVFVLRKRTKRTPRSTDSPQLLLEWFTGRCSDLDGRGTTFRDPFWGDDLRDQTIPVRLASRLRHLVLFRSRLGVIWGRSSSSEPRRQTSLSLAWVPLESLEA